MNRIEKVSSDIESRILDLAKQHDISPSKGSFMSFSSSDVEERLLDLEEYIQINGISEASKNRIRILLIATGFTIPTNSPLKANRALEVLNKLTDEQIEELMPVIQEAKVAMSVIREDGIKFNSPEICANCKGACCSHEIEGAIEEIDFFYTFFTVSKKKREEILAILSQNSEVDGKCSFQIEKGCIIPPISKPYFCQAHFCEEILAEDGLEQSGKYDAWLRGKIIGVKKKLKEMGYDLN